MKLKLKLAFLFAGCVMSTAHASESVSFEDCDSTDGSHVVAPVPPNSADMTDDEKLEFAIKKSAETAAAEEKFRAKKTEYTNGERGSIGHVAFEVLRRNVGKVAGDENDVSVIQSLINKVREAQRLVSLTDEQKDDADGFLISLVSRISVLSSEKRLGAQNRASVR
ncbi:MAG: hypothetical protein Q8R43_02190 [Alphaproteobacteria bacterium]|nr:hypothetical protein [Alphaproteobacteria bacterium]